MGVRALLVEDDRYLGMAITRGLRGVMPEIEVTVAPTLAEAKRVLGSRRFDFALAEAELPDGSGLDLVRRAREVLPDLPVVILIPPGAHDVGAAAVRRGAADFVEVGPELEDELPRRIVAVHEAFTTDVRRKRYLEFTDRLDKRRDVQGLLTEAARGAAALLDADSVMVWASSEGGHWESAAGEELPIEDASTPASVLLPLVGDPGETTAVLYKPDEGGDNPLDLLAEVSISHVAVGTGRAGRSLVVTLLAARFEGTWTEPELRWITAACAATARSCETVLKRQRALGADAEDSITGLPTRPALERALETEATRSLRQGSPIALMLIDIDDLRVVHEVHGPEACQELQRSMAEELRESVRKYDFPAQTGPGRFGVMMPAIASGQATAAAERLRRLLSSRGYQGTGVVTVSCGVASYPASANRVDQLIDVAEQALVLAKRQGKARTITAPERRTDDSKSERRGVRKT